MTLHVVVLSCLRLHIFFLSTGCSCAALGKGYTQEANAALLLLHGSSRYEEARRNLQEELQLKEQMPKYSFSNMLATKATRKALSLGVLLQAFQQLCGINTEKYYSPTILQIAGKLASRQYCAMHYFDSFVVLYRIPKQADGIALVHLDSWHECSRNSCWHVCD